MRRRLQPRHWEYIRCECRLRQLLADRGSMGSFHGPHRPVIPRVRSSAGEWLDVVVKARATGPSPCPKSLSPGFLDVTALKELKELKELKALKGLSVSGAQGFGSTLATARGSRDMQCLRIVGNPRCIQCEIRVGWGLRKRHATRSQSPSTGGLRSRHSADQSISRRPVR